VRRLGDTEVDELDDAGVSDEQVLRRDVAVHDAERLALRVLRFVRGVQSLAGLDDEMHGDGDRNAADFSRRSHDEIERLAVDPLHHEVEQSRLLAEVERLRDVRMPYLRGE
jgi:hypothetical protein